MMMKITLSLFLIASIYATEYDCSVGCSTDPNFMGSQVCGTNGASYMNECIAFCQNIEVARFGPCNDAGARIAVAEDWDTDTIVSLGEMQRFSSESFSFVGKRDRASFVEAEIAPGDELHTDEHISQGRSSGRAEDEPIRVTRVTSDGLQYTATISQDRKYGTSQPRLPSISTSDRRKLSILGEDTRSKVSDTTVFPYSAIASIDYSARGSGGCTGTVISRTSVVTSGHCLWNKNNKKWYKVFGVAPGRDAKNSNPFGLWEVDYVTTFEEWEQTGSYFYDVGVIELKPKVSDGCNRYVGDVVGIVGIDEPSPNDSRLREATITGFGADKHGQMWSSGRCDKAWRRQSKGEAAFGIHYCDTVGGNSGSSVITLDNLVLAIHGYGGVGDGNGGPLLERGFYTAVYEMAGLENDMNLPNSCLEPGFSSGGGRGTGNSEEDGSDDADAEGRSGIFNSCPCKRLRTRLFQRVCYSLFSRSCR